MRDKPVSRSVAPGGGQAGLADSYGLTWHGHAHIVLEQSDKASEAWRNHRWDSFTLNTPNWQSKLPGAAYNGPDPDWLHDPKRDHRLPRALYRAVPRAGPLWYPG